MCCQSAARACTLASVMNMPRRVPDGAHQNRKALGLDSNAATLSLPWNRSLNREQWKVLFASNLGWLFDSFEIYSLFLTVGFALSQLLDVAQAPARSRSSPS